jgi:PAS domain S-box-containing protein
MPQPLKVLIAEDSLADAELAVLELQRAGFEPDWQRVDTEAAFLEQLDQEPDLVLSDYQMPGFNGFRALELLKEHGLEVPFILVSGTVGEDLAVTAMKNGAADYLLKDRMVRLGPAVAHAMAEFQLRRERALADQALRASEKRFKALFDQAAVGFAQAEIASGRFTQVNQRFCEIVGRSRNEMEELTFFGISRPEDLELDRETFRRLKAGDVRESTHEKRYLRTDGSEVWVSLTVSAMWAAGEAPDYIIAVVQDVTERKKLEEQFRQAQKMEAIGTLAGGIAHDFNNILAAIGGYTELARMILKGNSQARIYLTHVLQAANRATDLVRQILTFSRPQPQELLPLQLSPVVAETFKLLRATIPTTIEFNLALATNAPTVLADSTQIHQILMNLGTNAWHAMKDRTGRLSVKLERWVVDAAQAATLPRLKPGIYARVSLSDTGCGMNQATLGRIFEPFFTTKPPGEGTGLGLAVVHGIMDHHGGAVTVQSEPDKGTLFQLYFPAHAGVPILTPTEEGPVPRGNGERILVVDDEEMIAEMIQRALGVLGYTVEFATQPEVALEKVRTDPEGFALVLTDQTMPGMTGLLLANLLKKIRPELPVIMMTGYPAELMSEKVAAAGIRQLLLKPITIRMLGTAVHAALLKRAGAQSLQSV